jgi:hypothetical protein|tara:strand:- start:1368 stop:1601 length:234 start_codon:yes stop_codon:yes gene_type:complete
MKKGLDDALMVSIGSMEPKGGRMPPDEGYMEDEEMIEEGPMEYSEDQHMMAEELSAALSSGDSQAILEAFHGIQMSY